MDAPLLHNPSVANDPSTNPCTLANVPGLLVGSRDMPLVLLCSPDHEQDDALLGRLAKSLVQSDFSSWRIAPDATEDGLPDCESYIRLTDELVEAAPTIGAQRVGLFGLGRGAFGGMLTAARNERIVCVAVWNLPIAPPSPAPFNDAAAYDPTHAARILRAPLLVVHNEETAGVEGAHDLACAARHTALEMVPGEAPSSSPTARDLEVCRRIAAFFAEHRDLFQL